MVAVAACSWGTWRFVLLAAERFAPGLDARAEGAIVMLVITIAAFAVMPFEQRGARPARTARDRAGAAWLGVAPATHGVLPFGATAMLTVGDIGPGALGGIFFIWALKRIRAADAATLTLLEPLVAVGIAVFAYHESLAPVSWLGASIILICAGSVMR